ncbi:hypothetical protein LDENG_00066010 [Lucifuga dentata]|nr:hypothetical protein LDENG_00066010 [Lucifuga dentata]
MKAHFIHLFDLLNRSGKTASISSPIPTLGYSILSLHTWLQSICSTHNIDFIHNSTYSEIIPLCLNGTVFIQTS